MFKVAALICQKSHLSGTTAAAAAADNACQRNSH